MKKQTPKHDRVLTVVMWVVLALAALPLLHYGRMALVCDSFVVRGRSMEPTLHQGERVWVNKLIMGPRIYTCFDFSRDTLACFRLPGFRSPRVGDIAVFNYPRGWTETRMGFRINYVYAKRCVGVPGDSVSVVGSRYRNSRVSDVGIPAENEAALAVMDDSLLLASGVLKAGYFAAREDEWTIKDFGPVLVPASGMSVTMDSLNLAIYKDVIEYETRASASAWLGREYAFRDDYYFFAGDNVTDSKDSRYIGFVPEDFIIGIVP